MDPQIPQRAGDRDGGFFAGTGGITDQGESNGRNSELILNGTPGGPAAGAGELGAAAGNGAVGGAISAGRGA